MNERIRKLMEQRAQAVTAMRAMLDKADAEKRDLTGEEENTYTQHDKDVDRFTKEIQREQRLMQMESEQRESANGERNPARSRQPGANQQPEQRDATDTDEYRRAMLRYMITGAAGGELRMDPRGEETRSILGVSLTGSDATGAVLAPANLERSLLADLADINVVRRLADVRSSNSDVEIPYVSQHTTAYMVEEGADFTASTPKFEKLTMGAHKAGALSYVTTEAMQDMFVDMEAFIRSDFSRAFAKLEEQQFISGTGTKQPSGILTGGTQALTTASATALTSDELLELIYAVPEEYRRNGTFITSNSAIKAIRKLKTNDGQYLWQPGMKDGQPDMLMGYRLHTSDAMPNMAAGAKAVIFGDLKQYRILDRRGLYFQRLNEIAATSGQVGFLAFRRYDARVMKPQALQYITMKTSG